MDGRHRQAIKALAAMLHEAQGVRDVELGRDIDIGGEVVTVRTVLDEYRAALAAATERAERLDRLHEEALASLSRAVDCVAEQRRRADALAARLAEVDGEHPA